MTCTPCEMKSSAMSGVTRQTRGRILDVGNHEIDLMVANEDGNGASHELASRPPDNVANEQQRGHAGSTGIISILPRRSSTLGRTMRNSPADAVARA